MNLVTAQMVKELRDRTGVGMGKCKEALEQAGGNIEDAIANLRKAGVATAVKKEGRSAKEGVVKVAENENFVGLIEINSETDFVVKNDRFQEFTSNLANTLLKTSPTSLDVFLKEKYDATMSIDEYRATLVQTLGENIQIKRLLLLSKKKDRSFGIYSHGGGRLVSLVEIEGSDQEQIFARDIAMHVAAEAPDYLTSDDIPKTVLDHEKEIAKGQIKNKPENIMEKIVVGKLKAFFDQVCLLNQHFVKDPNLTIQRLLEARSKEVGKVLEIAQFLRWQVGA